VLEIDLPLVRAWRRLAAAAGPAVKSWEWYNAGKLCAMVRQQAIVVGEVSF